MMIEARGILFSGLRSANRDETTSMDGGAAVGGKGVENPARPARTNSARWIELHREQDILAHLIELAVGQTLGGVPQLSIGDAIAQPSPNRSPLLLCRRLCPRQLQQFKLMANYASKLRGPGG